MIASNRRFAMRTACIPRLRLDEDHSPPGRVALNWILRHGQRPELIHENSRRARLRQPGCTQLVGHNPPKRRNGHLSLVCRLLRPYGRTELRLHQSVAVLGNSERQRRILQSERLVSALSAACELCSAIVAVTHTRPITRSSRWIISARPSRPRISTMSLDDRPLMRSASSAS